MGATDHRNMTEQLSCMLGSSCLARTHLGSLFSKVGPSDYFCQRNVKEGDEWITDEVIKHWE